MRRFSEWAADAVSALILTSFGHGFSWSPQRITSQNQQEASSYGYSAKRALKHQVGPLRRNVTDRKFMSFLIPKAFTWWIFETSESIFRKHSECSWLIHGATVAVVTSYSNLPSLDFYDDYKTSNSWNSCSWWLQTDRQVSSSAPWLWVICCQEWGEKKRPYFWPDTFFVRLQYVSEMINRE